MTATRTFARSAAVLGAATALTFAGAGAASAASTHSTKVTGNDVSVTFKKDGGIGIICGAVITQVGDAAGIAADLATGNLKDAFEALLTNPAVKVLKTEDPIPLPTVGLPNLPGLSDTVVVRDLDPNIYAVVSNCTLDKEPTINPFVIVGNPLEAVMGSVESGSSGDGLGTMSSIIGGGDSGLGDILSSAVGGGEGDGLGVLSSAIGGGGE